MSSPLIDFHRRSKLPAYLTVLTTIRVHFRTLYLLNI